MAMYILATSQTYPYSVNQLRRDNPGTSFPAQMPDERLADWGVFRVMATERPDETATTTVEQGFPVLVDGVWQQVWNVTSLTAEQIAQKQADRLMALDGLRAEAYRSESDPLFFKSQRGEATTAEWLAKVAEIKARYG